MVRRDFPTRKLGLLVSLLGLLSPPPSASDAVDPRLAADQLGFGLAETKVQELRGQVFLVRLRFLG